MKHIDKEFVGQLFANLANGNSDKFFNGVKDDVKWQVMGTHYLAGIYLSKEDFLNATFRRLNGVLQQGVILKVRNILLDNNIAIVEMESLSIANNNKPFNNSYCWIVEFDADQMIVSVRAYVDSALVQKVISENEPRCN